MKLEQPDVPLLFSETVVPDIFFAEYLSQMPSNSVKVYLYLMFEDINTEELDLQKEELSKVSWFTKNEFIELINKKEIVPHLKEYKELLNIMI